MPPPRGSVKEGLEETPPGEPRVLLAESTGRMLSSSETSRRRRSAAAKLRGGVMSEVGTDGLSDGLSDDGSSSEEGARRSEVD